SSAGLLLRSVSDRVELAQLTLEQTGALMRSVFGDVPHLPMLIARIHALSQGSPRTTMELAQHLVTRGVVHYEAAHCLWPEQRAESDLPASMAASPAASFAELSPAAREGCEVMSLTDGDSLAFEQYAWLTSHRDPKRAFVAFDELVAARVLHTDSSSY